MTWFNNRPGFRSTLAVPRFSGALLALALCLSALDAQAQVGAETANSGAKATVGGAFLGAEAVMVVEAAFDVQPWWAYAVGGGLGAAGGAVGGFFVDQQGDPLLSTSFLVAGMVFAIPSTIAVLSATAYKVDKNPTIDDQLALRAPVVPPSLVGYDEQGFRLDVPAVRVREVYSTRTRLTYALPSETEVMVPVVGMSF